jgi:hypothetical protein
VAVKFRGEWRLIRMEMTSNTLSYLDLVPLQQSFDLTFDVDNTLVRGNIHLLDRINALSLYKIRGGETIELEFSAMDESEYNIELVVTAVNVSEVSPGLRKYTLAVESVYLQQFLKHYSCGLQGTISSQVRSFVTQIMGINQPIETHDTNWQMNFTVNGWTGFNTIEFLESRSMSKTTNGGFRFFQVADGFKFISVADRLDERPIRTFTKHEEIDAFSVNIYTFDDIKIEKAGSFVDMIDGGYRSTLYTFDPFKKSYATFKHSTTNVIDEPYVVEDISKFFRYSYSESHPTMPTPRIIESFSKRKEIDQLFDDFVISIRVPGSIDNQPGDIIELFAAEGSRGNNGERSSDEYVSGKYMISRVACLLGENFMQRLTLKRLKDESN